jgi:hypothetical protein
MTAGTGDLHLTPWAFNTLFVLAIPIIWVAALAMISSSGWREIADAYPAFSDPPPNARRVLWGSMMLGGALTGVNYGSCINGWFSSAGLWLRPSLLFRPFHPMVEIPWSQMQWAEPERRLLWSGVNIGLAREGPDIWLGGRLGRAVLRERGAGEGRMS